MTMMKQSLLFILASLTVLCMEAQLSNSQVVLPQQRQLMTRVSAQVQEMKMRTPGEVASPRAKRSGEVNPFYCRPAGAFAGFIVIEDGTYAGMFSAPYITVKPFVNYTFPVVAPGFDENEEFWWYYSAYEEGYDGWQKEDHEVKTRDLTVKYGLEVVDVPTLENYFKYPYYIWQNHSEVIHDVQYGSILSVPNTMDIWDMDILKSSKTFCLYGRNGDKQSPLMTFFSGAEPFGTNTYGWWFGKNGYHQVYKPMCFIDGIAQAFEKPTAPYLLKSVAVDCAVLEVAGPVDMTCRVYKLDEIPPYLDEDYAVLPEEPGELIAVGRASLTPETADATGNFIFFTLYGEEDGLEFEITPTIDHAILVVVDGYNDPEMANLVDFSAMICSDMEVDEGYGELAYLKYGVVDEAGNLDHYEWAGLNNFFSSGMMKTGLSIFLSTENPYLTFNYNDEDGEYVFPEEGGVMVKEFGDFQTSSIEFYACYPSADGGWYMTCNNEEVPDWLTIELTDNMQNGEFSGVVNAEVVADPLPEGVSYREAIVRFGFPGAYLDYKFIQGKEIGPGIDPPEPSLADVNRIIGIILGDPVDEETWRKYDLNKDGEITISDVNEMIEILLCY